jgi:hypothetical protein
MNSGDSAVLNEVLACVQNADLIAAEEQILSSFTIGIVSSQDEETCKVAIASIIQALFSSNQKCVLNGDEPGIPSSILGGTKCMKAIIMPLFRDDRGSLILAQHLLGDTKANLMRAKLLEEVVTHAPKTAALNMILKQWANDQAAIKEGTAIAVPGTFDHEDLVAETNFST